MTTRELPCPRLHLVTNGDVLRRPDSLESIGELAARGSVELRIHVRAPYASGAFLTECVASASERIAGSGAALSVNDRAALAHAFQADLHLGQRSLSVRHARRVAPNAVIGVSCHDAREVGEAAAAGADYLFVGPAFATASHPGAGSLGPVGIARLVDRAGPVPIVAVGGITDERVGSMIDAGATGVAVIRGIWDAPDSPDALARYISALDSA